MCRQTSRNIEAHVKLVSNIPASIPTSTAPLAGKLELRIPEVPPSPEQAGPGCVLTQIHGSTGPCVTVNGRRTALHSIA